MEIAYLNDRLLPLMEVPPQFLDRGTFFGDGVYEVLRSYHGRIFALNEHLARFRRSADQIHIPGVDIPKIRKQILEAFEQAKLENAKIYFHVTRGCELRDHLPSPGLKPTFFLTVQELHDDPQKKQRGIKVSTHPDWRWKRCDIKSLNLLPNILARMEADRKGCTEAIFVNEAGLITEGASSAFFGINGKEKTLHTHPLGPAILPSITRAVVMEIACQVGLTPVEEAFTPKQAVGMDELLIAVTTKDIVPVVEFDGSPVADGRPGPCTNSLLSLFRQYAESH